MKSMYKGILEGSLLIVSMVTVSTVGVPLWMKTTRTAYAWIKPNDPWFEPDK